MHFLMSLYSLSRRINLRQPLKKCLFMMPSFYIDINAWQLRRTENLAETTYPGCKYTTHAFHRCSENPFIPDESNHEALL